MVELLVVIAIIGVLAGIAIPRYASYKDTAAKSAVEASAKAFVKALDVCLLEKASGSCDSFSELSIDCDATANTGNCAINRGTSSSVERICARFGKITSGSWNLIVIVPVSSGSPTYGYGYASRAAECNTNGTGKYYTTKASWAKKS